MAEAYEAGMRLVHDGRSSEALAVFRQAVDQAPQDADAWAGLALVLAQLNSAQEALEASDQAVKLDPTNAPALNAKVLALVSLGQYAEALEIAEEELQQTASLLRAVAHETTDAVFVKDKGGKYLLMNEAAARFVGKSVAEVLGKDDTELFDADSARRLSAPASR